MDRVGGGVVRRTGPWSPAVHQLLAHLASVGFSEAPRVLGTGDRGTEVLSWIEGDSGPDAWARVVPEEGLRAYARLLRRFHDCVADFRPSVTTWATEAHELAADEIITHGDPGPWNTVWRGDQPVGLIDWDMAGPRRPLYDVAYALEYAVPFRDDAECLRWLRYTRPPDRARRLAVFAEAYGLPGAGGLSEAVLAQQRLTVSYVRALGERGVRPQADWLADGFLDVMAARIAWSETNERLFR